MIHFFKETQRKMVLRCYPKPVGDGFVCVIGAWQQGGSQASCQPHGNADPSELRRWSRPNRTGPGAIESREPNPVPALATSCPTRAPQDGELTPLPSGFSAQSMCPRAGREGGCQLALLCPMPAKGRGVRGEGQTGHLFSSREGQDPHSSSKVRSVGSKSQPALQWHASARSGGIDRRAWPLSPGAVRGQAGGSQPGHPSHSISWASTTGASRPGQGFPPGSVCLHCSHPHCLSHAPAPTPRLPQATSWAVSLDYHLEGRAHGAGGQGQAPGATSRMHSWGPCIRAAPWLAPGAGGRSIPWPEAATCSCGQPADPPQRSFLPSQTGRQTQVPY
ncbi:uncharacterized protein LOC115271371 [Terrapene carolina triunguis]|uniref:uncharacterized protein LOC115271371 n=1 Tax=Terrapene triunguis TaxID=2587831 RepID=UPI0011564469|nr:uncharacterized protein LOC115271371 [Terrapene carolina triunguis]